MHFRENWIYEEGDRGKKPDPIFLSMQQGD
jgi:hypothetical protein